MCGVYPIIHLPSLKYLSVTEILCVLYLRKYCVCFMRQIKALMRVLRNRRIMLYMPSFWITALPKYVAREGIEKSI